MSDIGADFFTAPEVNFPGVVRLALTIGDAAGIGPEIALRAAQSCRGWKQCEIVLYGSPAVIQAAALKFTPGFKPSVMPVGDLTPENFVAGELSPRCGRVAYDTVVAATEDVLAGKMDAIVTAPVNKAAVNLCGINFTGHTELIAGLCHEKDYAMMQSAGNLRVVFVTTHIPLAQVSSVITSERIVKVGKLLNDVIVAEGVKHAGLVAAGINPHAGEDGFMGREDEDIVKPALAELRASGIEISGPLPSDTLFVEKIRGQYDGIISMYHDQGHIPFKMLAFDRGVNSTLGIPVIRCSVDHGTAFEIAWQGVADIGSMLSAVRLAYLRAAHRKMNKEKI